MEIADLSALDPALVKPLPDSPIANVGLHPSSRTVMTADFLQIDHELSWDQMFGGFLPSDANPFRRERAKAAWGWD